MKVRSIFKFECSNADGAQMPAECTGTKSGHGHTRSSLSLSKIDSRGDSKAQASTLKPVTTPSVATPSVATPSSFTTQPTHEEHPPIWANVVFDFVASSPFEISVNGKALAIDPMHLLTSL